MRTLVLLAASVALASAADAANKYRGVARSLYPLYEGTSGQFTCLDKSKTIPVDRVNDDFCDCPDGSDEPGTSACANGKFYCVNKGFRGKYIPSMQVNDGVCDCCDGSDEAKSCKNTCDVDGAAWREQQSSAIRKAEEGARLRLQYATEGQAATANRRTKLTDLQAKLESLRAEVSVAEAAATAAEAEEQRQTQAKKAEAAGNAEGIAMAALGLGDLDRDGLRKTFLEFVRTAGVGPQLESFLKDKVAAGTLSGATGADFVPKFLENPSDVADVKTAEGDRAREALSAKRSEESRLNTEIKSVQEEEGTDYGTDGAFYKLKGNCYDLRVNQYTYNVCPFGRAQQDSTHLGTFSGWKKAADGSNDYNSMLFTGGTRCWNGPDRSLALLFECGSSDALLSFDEPEKCTYAARFSTPAICDDRAARELKLELEPAAAHDEL